MSNEFTECDRFPVDRYQYPRRFSPSTIVMLVAALDAGRTQMERERFLAEVIAKKPPEPEQDPERWDGMS